ncbi:MAG: hypothetical protein IPJ08_05320 [Burkholderiales bacterium]|nr:hypothetical protein [Burkholderiales bacterium]
MNKPLTGTLIACVALALSQAACAMPQVQVSSPRLTANAAGVDFSAVRGSYVLHNGLPLNLSGSPQRPLARLGDRPAVHLVATAPNTYEAADGSLRLVFDAHANGVATEVQVTYTP